MPRSDFSAGIVVARTSSPPAAPMAVTPWHPGPTHIVVARVDSPAVSSPFQSEWAWGDAPRWDSRRRGAPSSLRVHSPIDSGPAVLGQRFDANDGCRADALARSGARGLDTKATESGSWPSLRLLSAACQIQKSNSKFDNVLNPVNRPRLVQSLLNS